MNKKFGVFTAGAVALAFSVSAHALELNVKNRSHSIITHMHFAYSENSTWGGDALEQPLRPGEDVRLHGIRPGVYNIKFVTARGTECESHNTRFDQDLEWVLTSEMIHHCE